jgi:hypothetical protein
LKDVKTIEMETRQREFSSYSSSSFGSPLSLLSGCVVSDISLEGWRGGLCGFEQEREGVTEVGSESERGGEEGIDKGEG